jgi:Uma2 family endonuclease
MVTVAPKPPPKIAEATEVLPIVLKLSPLIELTERQFADFCQLNPELHIERTATGELQIMVPAIGFTGGKELEIARQLGNWARQDGTGAAFGPSMGYTLPNGAVRAPDASWVLRSRRTELTPEDRSRFIHLCPDFVLELRSDTDRLSVLQAKMREYLDNGARLGWLIDPQDRRVYIYRPDLDVEVLENPETVSADPILPTFTLDLKEIWEWEL